MVANINFVGVHDFYTQLWGGGVGTMRTNSMNLPCYSLTSQQLVIGVSLVRSQNSVPNQWLVLVMPALATTTSCTSMEETSEKTATDTIRRVLHFFLLIWTPSLGERSHPVIASHDQVAIMAHQYLWGTSICFESVTLSSTLVEGSSCLVDEVYALKM